MTERATLAYMALGANLSALFILIANGWMQNPVGAEFNYETMRMELTSFADIFFNPVAQVKLMPNNKPQKRVLTALYHFLFVPLTIGLGMLLAIMESVYVMTGKQIYKDMTRFWGL